MCLFATCGFRLANLRFPKSEIPNLKSEIRNRWIVALVLALLLVAAASAEDLHPTPWYVDFLGQHSTLDGQPLPAGAVVRAYDPVGTLAGREEVGVAGYYLVSVYQDDSATPNLDEGAESGDPIAFTVDGYPAVALGPDAAVWDQSAVRLAVELRACTLAGDFDCDCRVTVADLMRQARVLGVTRGQAGYYPPLDRDGVNGIGAGDVQDVAGGWHLACDAP